MDVRDLSVCDLLRRLVLFPGGPVFPERNDEFSEFAEYFHSRQKWFYGLLAALFLADLIDTAIKGAGHFSSFGAGYPIRQGALAALAFIAMFVTDRRYHGAFAAVAIAAEVYWIASQFEVLE